MKAAKNREALLPNTINIVTQHYTHRYAAVWTLLRRTVKSGTMAVGRIFFQGGAVLAKFYFNHSNLTKQPLLLKTGKRQFARSKGAKVLPPTLVPGSIATRTMTIVTQHKKHCYATLHRWLSSITNIANSSWQMKLSLTSFENHQTQPWLNIHLKSDCDVTMNNSSLYNAINCDWWFYTNFRGRDSRWRGFHK